MKVALCYSGNFRTFNECSLNHYQFFKNISDEIDIYFSTWSDIKYTLNLNDPKHFFCKNRISENEKITENLIRQYIPQNWQIKSIKIQDYNTVSNFIWKNYNLKEKNLLYQYYKIKDCFDNLDRSQNYDLIVRIRPDITLNKLVLKDRIIEEVNNKKIIFNTNVWYNYPFSNRDINEMLWISNYDLMEKSAKIFDNFSKIKQNVGDSGMYGEKICYTNLILEGIQDSVVFFDFDYNVIR